MRSVSELKNQGIKSSVWNFLSTLTNQLRNFIVTLVLARILTPADFGLVSMAMVLNTILDTLADFGFSNAIVRRKEITEIETSTVFWINISIGFFCTLLVFLCAPIFAWFYDVPELRSIVSVTSLSFWISSFGTLQTALFQRLLNFRKIFYAKLISGFCSGILGVLLAILGCNVWALVFSNLSGWVMYTLTVWFMSPWRPKLIFKPNAVVDMFSFGWKMTLSTLINRIIRQLDTFIIGKLYSASTLGLFNRAQSLNNLIIEYSFSSVRSVLLPSLSKLQNELETLRYSVLKLMHTISFLTFLFAGLMYVCADDLILLFYGRQWEGAIDIFKILGLFSISLCLPIIFDTVITVANRMTIYLWISIISNAIILLSIFIGIRYGFIGYVWGVSIAGVVKLVPQMFCTNICIKLSVVKQLITIFKYALPFIIILLFCHLIHIESGYYLINIIFKGGIFFCIYIMINYILKNEGLNICRLIFIDLIRKKL